jgi:hypothetical protein
VITRTSRLRRGLAGAVVLATMAAACTSGGGDDAGPEPTTAVTAPSTEDAPEATTPAATEPAPEPDPTTGGDATSPAPTDPPVAVPAALQFSAPLVGGGEFDGAETAGTPTVFWFWAPT